LVLPAADRHTRFGVARLCKLRYPDDHLTSDEVQRIAKAMAGIPEFMRPRPGFCSREGRDRRWKPSHPYHMALQDWYVRETRDCINAMCARDENAAWIQKSLKENGG
jgi:hypothetical protein